MNPEIRCSITANDNMVESVSHVIDFAHMCESLDEFELKLNAVLSQLIKDTGDISADCNVEENNDDSEGDLEEQTSPMKKKKH